MNLFDRFILTIYSFALIVLSVVAIGIFTQLIPVSYVQAIVNTIYGSFGIVNPYLIVTVIFLLISLRFFFSALFTRKPRAEKGIRQRNEYGEVNITLGTIQTIAERAARRIKGVRDLKSVIKTAEGGNLILLRVVVDGETPIPELTKLMQHDVKDQVEDIAGVDITEVSVIVTEVATRDSLPVRNRRVE